MIYTIPKCSWCNKSDKMILKTIWYTHKGKKHYIVVWTCERCNAYHGEFWGN